MKKLKLVTTTITLVLLFIALIALVEKGSPAAYIFRGASPANVGILGTYDFLFELKKRYPTTTAIFSLDQLHIPKDTTHCLYIVISPELSYRIDDAKKILSELAKCEYPALLVADETPTSNILLEAANSSIRILNAIILDPVTAKPYPRAQFAIDNISETLTLDIASVVEGGEKVLGIVPRGLLYTPKGVVEAMGIPIAVYETAGRFRIIAVSDGSVFLNQVLTSSEGQAYLRVLIAMVDTLCEKDPSCIIAIDGSRYRGVPVTELLKNPATIQPYDLLTVIPLLIAKLIHPATWLPPLAKLLSRAVNHALATPGIATALIFGSMILSYYIVKEKLPREPDRRLPEQQEMEVFFTADVRSAIASGRYKLDKGDFLRLYEIVDTVLRSSVGYGLDDPRVIDVLSKNIDRARIARYVETMIKLRKKLVEHRLLPIVLSWNRTVTKLLRESEYVLRSIGASLEAEKGIEYVVMRGLR